MTSFGGRTNFKLSRRLVLGLLAALPAASAFATLPRKLSHAFRHVRPGDRAWPSPHEWMRLSQSVGGRLRPGSRPAIRPPAKLMSNPFYVGDQVGLTQSSGWLGAWRSHPSAWAVRAETPQDVAAAVKFAAQHGLRLVVKGGRHSYFGGSNAPDSLLLWTRAMDQIELHDHFVAKGCDAAPTSAVSVGAGCIWLHVYQAVCVAAGRYVQGGGCTTVGVAGLVQGGGFGSFSKAFGLASASLLEAEVVTADGKVRVVNACREPDLFWALKGGGGGTFGIVTRLTLRTHELPQTFGAVRLAVQAENDAAFEQLLSTFLGFYRDALMNPNWGEQARATTDRRLVIEMVFQGLGASDAKSIWAPFLERIAANREDWKVINSFAALEAPARSFWDAGYLSAHIPQAIAQGERAGGRPDDYWWAGDGEQVGAFWSGYCSTWLSKTLLAHAAVDRLAATWCKAAGHWPVSLHFNKGLAGASPEVLLESSKTPMNPEVLDAFALAIIAGSEDAAYPGWSEPDYKSAKAASARIHAANDVLRSLAPSAGSYVSESDYFLDEWKRAYWGEHWSRLASVKKHYDPDGLFVVHHGVGSERGTSGGFERIA